jgi:CheY-like chemotaxis protein
MISNKADKHVLLIDDDEMTRLLLKETVCQVGDFVIHEAEDGSVCASFPSV